MSVIYDKITNSSNNMEYIASASNTSLYMDSNFVTTFGPIWVPRVYGKDLTAFEIASSGKVAITINDVHSLDIARSNFTNANNYINMIEAYSNTALELRANDTDLCIQLDSASNNILVDAASNVTVNAKNGNMSLNTSNSYYLNSLSNLLLNASDSNLKIYFDHSTQSISLYTSNNYVINTSNSVNIDANSNFTLDTYHGDILINSWTSNITLYTSNNYTTTSSNNYILDVNSNIDITAYYGDITAQAIRSNINMYSSNNFNITSSNNYYLQTTSNVDLKSRHGDIVIESLTSNIFIYTSNNFALSASNDISVQANSNINISSYNEHVVIQSLTSNASMYASNFINITTSNHMYLNASSNISIKAHEAHVDIVADKSNLYLYASNEMFIRTSNNFYLSINSNIETTAVNGDITTWAYSNIKFNADNSNVYVNMNVPADTLEMYSLSNIYITSCNNYILGARSNTQVTTSNFWVYAKDTVQVRTSNSYTIFSKDAGFITACNELTIEASNLVVKTKNDMNLAALSNINFYMSSLLNQGSSNAVLMIQPGKIQVVGDIDLTGSLNTSNILATTVVQDTLKINDKRIIIANGDNNTIAFDDLNTNDSSGIIIRGYPDGNSNWIYEEINKSLLWNINSGGMPALGTNTGINTESFWELQGGSFRITYKKNYGTSNAPNVKDVTFGFRINEFEELELIKRFWDTRLSPPAYVNKRVARFGRFY